MRIDVQQLQSIQQPRQVAGGQQAAGFEKGEVVQATVVAKDGDAYILRHEDGRLFKATLKMDAVLQLQDQLEFVVTAKDGARMSMQMISITHGESGAQEPFSKEGALLTALGLPEDAGAKSLLEAFREMGFAPSKATLLDALAIMEQTGLSPKEAAFFAANHIPATEEAVNAFRTMQQGQTLGVLLFEASEQLTAGGQSLEEAMPETLAMPAARMEQAVASQGGAAIEIEQSVHMAESPAPSMAQTEQGVQAPADADAQAATGALTDGKVALAIQDGADVITRQAEAVSLQEGGAINAAPEAQGEIPTGIAQRLLAMFTELDGGMDGSKLKRAAAETAQHGETMKRMLEGEGLWGRATDRLLTAAAQVKLTQDVQRFYCLHIPVYHQSPDTAELYLYKNKRGGMGIDPENAAILIGLETANMGRVESLIRVERKNISIVFSIEKEEGIPLVKDRARELYPVLKEHNYTLIDTKVHKLVAPTSLANAEEVLEGAVSRPRVNVDCKI